MRVLMAAMLLCGALGANAGCPVPKPGKQPMVPDGAVATENEMYRAQLAAERYLLQAQAYLDCDVMNRRQHNLLLTRMEIFSDDLREAQVEFQVRDNILAGN